VRRQHIQCLAAVFLMVAASSAQADLSASDFLNNQLAHAPLVIVNRTVEIRTHYCSRSPGGGSHMNCGIGTRQETHQLAVPPTVTNSRVIRATNIQLGRPTFSALPFGNDGNNYIEKTYNNCSSKTTLTDKLNFTASGTEGWTIVKTQAIQATQNTSISLAIPLATLAALFSSTSQRFKDVASVPPSLPENHRYSKNGGPYNGNILNVSFLVAQADGGDSGMGGTLSFGQTWSNQITTTSQHTESSSKTVVRGDETDVSVPPNASVEYTDLIYQGVGSVPFTADVVVDGDIATNLSGVKSASQVLPDEQNRLMKFSGVLILQEMSRGVINTHDTNFCSSGSNVTNSAPATATSGAARVGSSDLGNPIDGRGFLAIIRPRHALWAERRLVLAYFQA